MALDFPLRDRGRLFAKKDSESDWQSEPEICNRKTFVIFCSSLLRKMFCSSFLMFLN